MKFNSRSFILRGTDSSLVKVNFSVKAECFLKTLQQRCIGNLSSIQLTWLFVNADPYLQGVSNRFLQCSSLLKESLEIKKEIVLSRITLSMNYTWKKTTFSELHYKRTKRHVKAMDHLERNVTIYRFATCRIDFSDLGEPCAVCQISFMSVHSDWVLEGNVGFFSLPWEKTMD